MPNCNKIKHKDHKVYQMVIKDIKIFLSKGFQNLPKLGASINHLATLI
jgi:hypothetical protein